MSAKNRSKCFLWFHVELLQVYFTQPGRYFLKLGIWSSKGERTQVQLYVNEASSPINDFEFNTDSCLQDDLEVPVKLNDSKFTFCMPAVFASGEVKLFIEAFRVSDNPLLDGERYGEFMFLVHPRPYDKVKLKSKSDKEFYHFETQMPLNQILDTEGIGVNIAVLKAVVSLRQDEKVERLGIRQKQHRKRDTKVIKVAEYQHANSETPLHHSVDRTNSLKIKEKTTSFLNCSNSTTEHLPHSLSGSLYMKRKGGYGLKSQEQAGSLANFYDPVSDSGHPSGKDSVLQNEAEHKLSGLVKKKQFGRFATDRVLEGGNMTTPKENVLQNKRELGFGDMRTQQRAGSLANLYYPTSDDKMVPCRNNLYVDEGKVQDTLSRSEQEKQEKAGSLANLYVPSCEDTAQEPSLQDGPGTPVNNVIETQPMLDTKVKAEDNLPDVYVCKDKEDLEINERTPSERFKAKAQIIYVKEAKGKESKCVDENSIRKGRFVIQEPKREPLSVPDELSAPGPSTVPDNYVPIGVETIADSALAISSSVVPLIHLCGSYVARGDHCEVAVLVHAAVGLPAKADGRSPQPYVTASTRRDQERQVKAQSATHPSIQPTHSPSWDEALMVEFPEDQAKQEDIVLTIADHPSRELLAQFRIPVGYLRPFHPYHLELVQPSAELSSDTRLFITVILKKDSLDLPSEGATTYGFEVIVRGFESPIINQMGPLIAVTRVVPNWSQYKSSLQTPQPRPAGVTMTTIHFPSPHPTSFAVAGPSQLNGAPQVTVASDSQESPQWNQTFYFAGEESSLFAPGSSLIIEYYPASLAMNQDSWQLNNPIGYSHHSLDQFLLSSLKHENGRLGLRLVNLPVEGDSLKSSMGSTPTVGLVLRLLNTEKPDDQMSAAQINTLPIFRSGSSPVAVKEPAPEQPGLAQQPSLAQFGPSEQNRFGLPASDAVRNLLPNFHSLCMSGSPQPVIKEYVPIQGLNTPSQERDPNSYSSEIPEDVRSSLDVRGLAILDYQMKEVDRYRTAMRKMATDLMHLRGDRSRLEGDNSRLRRELQKHDEISRIMVSSQELDHITHSELIQKFVLMKTKLADESTKKQELHKRVQHLQNDLIKKNEMEKEFVRLQDAHNGQQALLQKLQSKVQKTKTLQETCKKQEKVIVELEQLLAKHVDEGAGKAGKIQGSAVKRLPNDENARLRAELLQCKELLKAAESKVENARTSTSFGHMNGTFSDQDRLQMFENLDKAEGRIFALEKELTENARKWAKEKADLQLRLNESQLALQTGFRNSITDLQTLHNAFNGSATTPPPSGSRRPTQPPPGPRRPSPKLDPLRRWPEYQ